MDIFQNSFLLKCEEFLLSKGFTLKRGKYYLDDTVILIAGSRVDIKTRTGQRAIYGKVEEDVLYEFIERYWEDNNGT